MYVRQSQISPASAAEPRAAEKARKRSTPLFHKKISADQSIEEQFICAVSLASVLSAEADEYHLALVMLGRYHGCLFG